MMGCYNTEDQEHILRCPALRKNDEDDLIDYKDIYSQDLIKIKKVTQILMTKFYKFTKRKAMVHGLRRQNPVLQNQRIKLMMIIILFIMMTLLTCLNLSWNNTHTHNEAHVSS